MLVDALFDSPHHPVGSHCHSSTFVHSSWACCPPGPSRPFPRTSSPDFIHLLATGLNLAFWEAWLFGIQSELCLGSCLPSSMACQRAPASTHCAVLGHSSSVCINECTAWEGRGTWKFSDLACSPVATHYSAASWAITLQQGWEIHPSQTTGKSSSALPGRQMTKQRSQLFIFTLKTGKASQHYVTVN